jgi:hypothetical protein
MTTDYMKMAADLAFQRAANKPMTHWTRSEDCGQRAVIASCGRAVAWDQIPNHGEPPTCPRCLEDYDAFQRAEV